MKRAISFTWGVGLVGLVLDLVLGVGGCASNDQSQPSQVNSAQSQPYSPGTGVSSSSFDRHPRFYTGPNGQPD